MIHRRNQPGLVLTQHALPPVGAIGVSRVSPNVRQHRGYVDESYGPARAKAKGERHGQTASAGYPCPPSLSCPPSLTCPAKCWPSKSITARCRTASILASRPAPNTASPGLPRRSRPALQGAQYQARTDPFHYLQGVQGQPADQVRRFDRPESRPPDGRKRHLDIGGVDGLPQ